jgi:hypothetical protein
MAAMDRATLRGLLTDRHALTCTLYGEAAGEPVHSQIAVGCVIRNRVHMDVGKDGKPDWWGEGYVGVCLAKMQFSCWWEDTPNSARLYALAEALIKRTPIGEQSLVTELQWVAEGLIGEQLRDVTRGATHYLTAALYKAAPPNWAKGRPIVASVGAHLFFVAA